MPIFGTDTLVPDGGPTSLNGFGQANPTWINSISDSNDETTVEQIADACNFSNLSFTDFNNEFVDINSFDVTFRMRPFRGNMNCAIVMEDDRGTYNPFTLTTEGTALNNYTHSFLQDSAGDVLDTTALKNLSIRECTISGFGGGTGSAFRLFIADIFIVVNFSTAIPTKSITLDGGAITLDSGKITVQ